MNLDELRKEIETIDLKMMELFIKRMAISLKIGLYKKEHQLPILDQKREDELISKYLKQLKDQTYQSSYVSFIKHIMHLSKEIQK
jgi:monofunctional chorismate mutase